MGGGGGGPTESTVTQTNLPEYAEPFYRDLLTRVGYESSVGYQPYQGRRLEYFTPAEQEAMRRFEQMGVSGTPPELDAAGSIAAQVGTGNPYAGTMLEVTRRAQEMPGYASSFRQGNVYHGYDPRALDQTYIAGTTNDPSRIQSYMSPYQQLVVDREKEEARRQSDIMGQQTSLQAAGTGSLGGYREAIMQAERERNLEDQMGDIQAAGSQQAYQQALQSMEADRSARAQQMQFNISAYQAGEQARQQAAQLGLSAQEQEQRGRMAEEEARRAAHQMNLDQARAAATLGQQAYGQLMSGDQQRLAAAGLLGDFVSQRQQMEMERLMAMQSAGQIQRELMQRGLDIGYADFLRQQAYPKEQLSFYSSMMQGIPIAPGQVSQSYGITPSMTQQLLGSGIAGVGLYNAFR